MIDVFDHKNSIYFDNFHIYKLSFLFYDVHKHVSVVDMEII
jgi:hypothetical protein